MTFKKVLYFTFSKNTIFEDEKQVARALPNLEELSHYKNTIDFAREQGEAEGRENGRAEIIKKFFDSGMSVEQIAKVIEMPLEQVIQYVKIKTE